MYMMKLYLIKWSIVPELLTRFFLNEIYWPFKWCTGRRSELINAQTFKLSLSKLIFDKVLFYTSVVIKTIQQGLVRGEKNFQQRDSCEPGEDLSHANNSRLTVTFCWC